MNANQSERRAHDGISARLCEAMMLLEMMDGGSPWGNGDLHSAAHSLIQRAMQEYIGRHVTEMPIRTYELLAEIAADMAINDAKEKRDE